MYVCGPTRLRRAARRQRAARRSCSTSIRRYLEWTGFDVTFVSNVTDVEDKIIARAARAGTTEPELAPQYEAVYFDAHATGSNVRRRRSRAARHRVHRPHARR